MKTRISGKEAARVAEDMAKPGPIRVVAASEAQEAPGALVPSPGSELDRKAPPRVRKPLPRNDQWKAPTPDLEGHRKRLREALGNTLSDEFVDVILGKLVEALRPGLYDQLDEATLNAALATIDSMRPRSELQALLAVQIIATGFAGLRFLRQSHRNMTEDFINVYGNYAIKLLRLQNDLIQTFDRYRRGNKQTVEVRHVHIHSGAQGVVGIINPPEDREGRSPPQAGEAAETAGSRGRADRDAPGPASEIDRPAQSAGCGGGADEGGLSFAQGHMGGHDEGVVGIINSPDDREGGSQE